MRTVGIKELKNELSRYVKLAAAGETVLVTDRRRVVAELGAPGTIAHMVPAQTDAQRRWAELIKEGHVRPATLDPSAPLPPRHPIMAFADLMMGVDSDREDR